MNLHDAHRLTPVINAAGTFTPLGVSRSSAAVAQAVSQALGGFFVIDELQAAASRAVSVWTGAEAAAVTHCVAAGITLAVAACMAGDSDAAVAALPDASGLPNRVIIPAGHAVNYGHPITTDVRLAGAQPVLAGSEASCTVHDIDTALAHERTAGLLLVSSRLVQGQHVDLADAVAAAHRRGVPAIIDGAAQDMRIEALLVTGADIVLVSAHKYLASPTAGLIIGRRSMVQACRAHERGIGHAMKASKEAIVGVIAAIDERTRLDRRAWRDEQDRKVTWFVEQLAALPGQTASAVPDPAGMPFARVGVDVNAATCSFTAASLAAALRDGTPSVRLMEHGAAEGRLTLELVPLNERELHLIVDRLAGLLVNPRR
ncbi:MAG: aminotransferase class V-fold PLP-dependent enzyme [Rubrivivax sp.]